MKLLERIYLKMMCVLILFLLSTNIDADEITVFRGNYLEFSLFGDTQNNVLEIRFDTEKTIYYLFYRLPLTETPVWISLTENNLVTLRNNMKKFIEWENIAQKKMPVSPGNYLIQP